jgi:hypothetical protein
MSLWKLFGIRSMPLSDLLACIVSRVHKSRGMDSLLPGRRTRAVCYTSCVTCPNRVSCVEVRLLK